MSKTSTCINSSPCAGQALLLPLTASVYVAGELTSNSSALVDIGTGYYVEVSAMLCPALGL